MSDETPTQEIPETQNESPVIRSLRRELRAAHKEIGLLNKELDSFQNPVVSDADLEGADDEAGTDEAPTEQGETVEQIEARVRAETEAQRNLADVSSLSGRISSAASGAPEGVESRLMNAKTPAEIAQIMKEAEGLHRG